MLTARLDGLKKNILLLVLTEENLEHIRQGHPLTINLNEFFPEMGQKCDLGISHTHDEVWVEQQVQAGGDIIEAIQESLKRPVVLVPATPPELIPPAAQV